jgi:hypothetical protein
MGETRSQKLTEFCVHVVPAMLVQIIGPQGSVVIEAVGERLCIQPRRNLSGCRG